MKNEPKAKPTRNLIYDEKQFQLQDVLDCNKGYIDCGNEQGDDYPYGDDNGDFDGEVYGSDGNDEDKIFKADDRSIDLVHDYDIISRNDIREWLCNDLSQTNCLSKQMELYAKFL